MIHQIFAVFDSKAEAYMPPFYYHAEPMAVRTFRDACTDVEHQFGKHPEDYTLFHMGTYDDMTGIITQDKITSIANGLQLQET